MPFDTEAEGWRQITLGQIITLEYGRALPESARQEGLVPVYGSNGRVGSHSDHLVAERGIVIGRKGTAGSVHTTEGPFWPIDTAYYVKPRTAVDFDWLVAVLRRAGLHALNEATGVPGLNRDKAYREQLWLPPLDEQRRIAEVLKSVEENLTVSEEVCLATQTLLTAYLDEAFHGVSDDDLGRPLEDLLTKVIDYRGVPPPKSDTGVPLITAKNVRFGYLDQEPREFIAERDYDAWMRRGVPSAGDILFTTEAPLGFVAEYPSYKAALGQRTITLVADPARADRKYLKWLLLSPPAQESIFRHATGSTAKGIKQSTFRRLHFRVPSVQEQQRIAAPCEDIWAVLASARATKTRLVAMRNKVAADLLSGRVRVPA